MNEPDEGPGWEWLQAEQEREQMEDMDMKRDWKVTVRGTAGEFASFEVWDATKEEAVNRGYDWLHSGRALGAVQVHETRRAA